MKELLKILAKVLLSMAVASVLAYASAYFILGRVGVSGNVRNGIWETDLSYGGESAGLYQRAQVALYGLFALNSTETVYFITKTDSDGILLKRQCVYRIEGTDPDTRWWSLTAYNNYYLIPNVENRYSFSRTTVIRETDGSWKIKLANQKQEKNWLPSGDKDGDLVLNLRVYNPTPLFVQEITKVSLPTVVKESCQ